MIIPFLLTDPKQGKDLNESKLPFPGSNEPDDPKRPEDPKEISKIPYLPPETTSIFPRTFHVSLQVNRHGMSQEIGSRETRMRESNERDEPGRGGWNKDENIAGFIAVLIIKSIKYGSSANETRKIADSHNCIFIL